MLKAISYRAWLVAVKQKRGAVYEFHTASLARTGDEVHARLNTQRKNPAHPARALAEPAGV